MSNRAKDDDVEYEVVWNGAHRNQDADLFMFGDRVTEKLPPLMIPQDIRLPGDTPEDDRLGRIREVLRRSPDAMTTRDLAGATGLRMKVIRRALRHLGDEVDEVYTKNGRNWPLRAYRLA